MEVFSLEVLDGIFALLQIFVFFVKKHSSYKLLTNCCAI